MDQVDFWRQLDIVSPSKLTFPITVIGAGGIGSTTSLLLAKMGCQDLTVVDFDQIEAHNFPSQLYRLEDNGRAKVEALADVIQSFTGTKVKALNQQYDRQPLVGFVIACVDSMAARQRIWQAVQLNVRVPFFIDARMGGQSGQVYALNPCTPDKIREYEACLFADDEAVEEPCTAQAIIYNTFMIASVIGVLVKTFAMKEELPLEGVVKLIDVSNLALY